MGKKAAKRAGAATPQVMRSTVEGASGRVSALAQALADAIAFALHLGSSTSLSSALAAGFGAVATCALPLAAAGVLPLSQRLSVILVVALAAATAARAIQLTS